MLSFHPQFHPTSPHLCICWLVIMFWEPGAHGYCLIKGNSLVVLVRLVSIVISYTNVWLFWYILGRILSDIKDLFSQIGHFSWADQQLISVDNSWSVENQCQIFGHLPDLADLAYDAYLQLILADFSYTLAYSSLWLQISNWGFSWLFSD